ncbi:MAG TPA: hypothetical protein VFA59_17615 [Vicinamibacterales bacterium]|nr:hypothetical protein [Vicinamibacterales bacterium]
MTTAATTAPVARARPPLWLLLCTGGLALTILALAVAETNLKAHYLIDQGEFISVFGLGFIGVAGLFLYRSKRLYASLPLVFPWLLYPIITQGDQIIDNLSINPMRVICHVLLAAIFGTPVAVIIGGINYVRGRGAAAMSRRASTTIAAVLLAAEIWLAYAFLGWLMIWTLVLMIGGVLIYGMLPASRSVASTRERSERFALAVLIVGVVASAATYFGYKNQPGAYQGSPSFFMDPSMQDSEYKLDRVPVPTKPPSLPSSPALVAGALTAYGRTLDGLLAGYHILDRNYTYDFHNELFLRHQVLLPNYRQAGLERVAEARALRVDADRRAAEARVTLANDDPLAALLDDLRGYVAFNFNRAPILEQLSGNFAKTPAGLQHAAHLYEGESKYLGTGLSALLRKHHVVMDDPQLRPVVGDLAQIGDAIYAAYAHHVVGF